VSVINFPHTKKQIKCRLNVGRKEMTSSCLVAFYVIEFRTNRILSK